MSEGTITRLANKEEGNGGARIVAGIAMLLAPPVIALEVGSWSPGLLIGTSVGAGLLVFAMLSLRRWIGGIDEAARATITSGIMARIPERTESTKTWIVANRIPRSVTERGVAIVDEAKDTGE